MKKIIVALLVCVFVFASVSCSPKNESEESVNIPENADVVLEIAKESNGKTVYAVGTELDPHFFSQNVGLKGYSNGQFWECKEDDWALIESRIADMRLRRIRCMLLPSWYVISSENVKVGSYNWNSKEMRSLYKTLDTAKKFGMTVNVTFWGCDVAFMRDNSSSWATPPNEQSEQDCVDSFADCVKYLIEEKGYDCIKEVTLFNEPNSVYSGTVASACKKYCDLCVKLDESFRAKGIRDKVLFNLSDDARDCAWLAITLQNLEGIIDIANSHTYSFGDTCNEKGEIIARMSNKDICYDLPNYNLNDYKSYVSDYDVPHMWGEFGTINGVDSHKTLDKYTARRGLDVARIALNMFNMGGVGVSYWVLFSQYYSANEFSSGKIMDMGLWGFADEGYKCRPVYYSYSMMTRFIEPGDAIYPIVSEDGSVVAVAFGKEDKWSYCVVNNGETDKQIAFVNRAGKPTKLNRYVYEESSVPDDNQVIGSDLELTSDGRVLSDALPSYSFAVYTNR